ncbi:MAG: glycosyltransferase, partial [Gammaproteobacteria bacterium]|nr:glycosyltransferase [Gammaproteobacteria bacterium]
MAKLLIDGIFFQINNTGIARVWDSIIPYLVKKKDLDIFVLDRGGMPHYVGVTHIPFPTYNLNQFTASDSVLIEKISDQYKIDVFTSTYYTSPLSTPMVLMVYDMIPELFAFNMSERPWMEKTVAISFAQRYVCISESTRRDLLSIFPEISPQHAVVGLCGIDRDVFFPASDEEVTAFKKKFSLDRPYYLFVGSRVQHTG